MKRGYRGNFGGRTGDKGKERWEGVPSKKSILSANPFSLLFPQEEPLAPAPSDKTEHSQKRDKATKSEKTKEIEQEKGKEKEKEKGEATRTRKEQQKGKNKEKRRKKERDGIFFEEKEYVELSFEVGVVENILFKEPDRNVTKELEFDVGDVSDDILFSSEQVSNQHSDVFFESHNLSRPPDFYVSNSKISSISQLPFPGVGVPQKKGGKKGTISHPLQQKKKLGLILEPEEQEILNLIVLLEQGLISRDEFRRREQQLVTELNARNELNSKKSEEPNFDLDLDMTHHLKFDNLVTFKPDTSMEDLQIPNAKLDRQVTHEIEKRMKKQHLLSTEQIKLIKKERKMRTEQQLNLQRRLLKLGMQC